MTRTGHAFLNSSHTGIVTVVVRVQDPYEGEKYYFLAIKDWSDPEADIMRAMSWGNTLHPLAGAAIMETCGTNEHIKFASKNINLRKRYANIHRRKL